MLAAARADFVCFLFLCFLCQLLPPAADQSFSPNKAGLVTMTSFMVFGSIPLLPYLIALLPGVHFSPDLQLWLSIGFTVVTLFLLGAFKGRTVEVKRSAWWKAGMLMAFNGSVAAVVGYLSGWAIAQVMDLPPGQWTGHTNERTTTHAMLRA
jgi:hypothetical protein